MKTLFRNERILTAGLEHIRGTRRIDGDRIDGLFPDGEADIPADRIVDLEGQTLLPGFFDIHFHGRDNCDFSDADEEGFRTIARGKLSEGVTSFLITTLSLSGDSITRICRTAARYIAHPEFGRPLGLHLEGPFFNPAGAGAQNPAYLPIWIAAGIRAEMEEQLGPERLLRSNRQYPITRALLAAGLSLPDFRYMTGGLDPLRFAPGELKWYREFSRLLLEILYGLTSPTDNALFDYAVLSADPAHTAEHVRASTIDRVLRNAAAKSGSADSKEPVDIQRFLEQCARRTVWHLFAPRPPEIAEAEFRKIDRLVLPFLDADGNATGKTETVPLDTLPERIAGRPDALDLRNGKINEIHRLAPGNSPEVVSRYRELIEALQLLPLKPEDPAGPAAAGRFRNALSEVKRYFPRRARLEEKLDDYARQAATPAERYTDRVEALRATPSYLSEKAGRLLERVEQRYLDE